MSKKNQAKATTPPQDEAAKAATTEQENAPAAPAVEVIASLELQLAAKDNELKAQNQRIEELEAANKTTLEEIQLKVDILEEEVVDKDEAISELQAQVAGLSETTQQAKAATLPVVECDGKNYQTMLPAVQVKIGGKLTKVMADDLKGNDELVLQLIEMKSGMLKAL